MNFAESMGSTGCTVLTEHMDSMDSTGSIVSTGST